MTLYEDLQAKRFLLEKAWGHDTRHPDTEIRTGDPLSKGQCGVTSAYLAREFEQQNKDVLFCTGRVSFSDRTHDIEDHCWLKISDRQGGDVLIIDLTADQNGHAVSVICESDACLQAVKTVYQADKERRLSEINHEQFLLRLKILIDKVSQH